MIERAGEDPVTTVDLLRTPSLYGSLLFRWQPSDVWELNTSAILTGPMLVANERTQSLHRTPWFADVAVIVGRTVALYGAELTVTAGVQNVLNSYQRDLEVGADRDAAFMYGPMRPRTITVGIRME